MNFVLRVDVYSNNRNTNSTYAAAGNLTVFGSAGVTYDAENRQTAAGSNSYLYDGAGQRVGKTTLSAQTVYVYGAFGQLAAEYSSASGSLCTTCYLSYDYLGSVRLVTDQNRNVVARHDYAPFGQEIPAGVGGRTSQWGASDNVNQKFTGQERDSETALDFFQARYMSAGLGRFMSPDPGNAGVDITNPQSWNGYGYGYVLGNPLNSVDPSGMFMVAPQPLPDPGDEGGNQNPDWFLYNIFNYAPSGSAGGGSNGPVGRGGGPTFYATGLYLAPVSTPSTATLTPAKNVVPDNVCEFAGNAPDPSFWASAGKASKWNPVAAVLDLTKGFKVGGYLDAQPIATGDPYQRAAYGNYVFGAWMRASGTPLPIALAGANEIAFIHKLSNRNQYRGRQMDSFFWSLPAANVTNIVNGYNAQKNGTLCHK